MFKGQFCKYRPLVPKRGNMISPQCQSWASSPDFHHIRREIPCLWVSLGPLSLIHKSLLCRSPDRPFGRSRSVGGWRPGYKSTQLLSEPGPQPFPTLGLSVLRLVGWADTPTCGWLSKNHQDSTDPSAQTLAGSWGFAPGSYTSKKFQSTPMKFYTSCFVGVVWNIQCVWYVFPKVKMSQPHISFPFSPPPLKCPADTCTVCHASSSSLGRSTFPKKRNRSCDFF